MSAPNQWERFSCPKVRETESGSWKIHSKVLLWANVMSSSNSLLSLAALRLFMNTIRLPCWRNHFEGPQSVRIFCGFKFGCQPNTLGFAMGRRPCSPVQSSRVRQTKLYKFSYASTVSLGLLSSLISMDTLLDKERMLLMSRVNAEKPAC